MTGSKRTAASPLRCPYAIMNQRTTGSTMKASSAIRERTTDTASLLYFGQVKGCGLVFIRHGDACRLARIHWATDSSGTWGEFASRVPTEVMDELLTEESRISFPEFCRSWLYQALGWAE